MKKKLFLMGMLSMALVFGFVLTGCPTDGDDNGGGGDGGDIEWAGTWKQIKDADGAAIASGSSYTITLAAGAGYEIDGPDEDTISEGGKSGASWDPDVPDPFYTGGGPYLKLKKAEDSVAALYAEYEKISATQIKIISATSFPQGMIGAYEKQNANGVGDDNGAGSYTFEVSDNGNAYSITIRGVNITTDISDGRTGFTVKVDGADQTLSEAYAYKSKSDNAYVKFGDGESLTTSSVVTISYDGTGAFAGQLDTFTDKVCTWDDH
ncbi:MAG: hypothetical protein LBD47_01710 [Treponema sp.]|jgi:hypothetical protein|nr:hypothetical protein [Treponema sp.]